MQVKCFHRWARHAPSTPCAASSASFDVTRLTEKHCVHLLVTLTAGNKRANHSAWKLFSQTTAFVIRWNARSFSYFTVRIFESKTLCISSAIRNLLVVFMLQSKNTECDWWTLSPDWVDLPITLPEPLVLMLTQVLEGPRHACLVPRKHEGVIMCLLFAVKSPFTM